MNLKYKQRVNVFHHLNGMFRDLVCLNKLRVNFISLCRYLWQRFGGGDVAWEWPRDYWSISISSPGSLPVDKGTSCGSQQVGSRKLGGLDSRNLAPQRLLKSHCSRVLAGSFCWQLARVSTGAKVFTQTLMNNTVGARISLMTFPCQPAILPAQELSMTPHCPLALCLVLQADLSTWLILMPTISYCFVLTNMFPVSSQGQAPS